MPRLSLRKLFLSLFFAALITLGIFNLNNTHFEFGNNHGPMKQLLSDSEDGANPDLVQLRDEMGTFSEDIVTVSDDQLKSIPKLWFMKDGWVRPERAKVDRVTNQRIATLWPEEDDGDRIVQQLMYVPPDYPSPEQRQGADVKLKKILLYFGIHNWKPLKLGRESFLSNNCPVDTCEITTNRHEGETADAIMFRDHLGNGASEISNRPYDQVWILYILESPLYSHAFPYKNIFNWTATYRHDSDIVTPYEKFVPYKEKAVRRTMDRNYAASKTKKVAWFVSNCAAQNNRHDYAKELARYIDVDIYGSCGPLQCPRSKINDCFKRLSTDYKFYLSFENSNCKDYITEKFFVNGLGNDVVPIVMGARKEDYVRSSPPHSFIHVDEFASPKELADYLNLLDRNDTLYNDYFRWKGTGEFVNTYFWCRLCAMLHDRHPPKVYEDVNTWWRGEGTCAKLH